MAARIRVAIVVALASLAGVGVCAPGAGAQTVAEQVDSAHAGVASEAIGPSLAERWRRVFDPSVPIDHTVRFPLVAGGRVFVAVQPSGEEPVIHALSAVTGETLWTRALTGWLQGLALAGERVLVSNGETLHALSASTGAVLWSRSAWPGREIGHLDNGVVADGDTAYAGVTGYGGAVYALDVGDGSVRWRREGYQGGGIAVAGDRLVVNAGPFAAALRRRARPARPSRRPSRR